VGGAGARHWPLISETVFVHTSHFKDAQAAGSQQAFPKRLFRLSLHNGHRGPAESFFFGHQGGHLGSDTWRDISTAASAAKE